jgi:hypothetical protein
VQNFVEICGFAICGLTIQICGFADWHGTPEQFAHLRLWNKPKNLRICDLVTFIEEERDDAHDTGGGEVLLLHLLQVPHLPGRQGLLQGDVTINQSPNL